MLRHKTSGDSCNRHFAASLFANHISSTVLQEARIDSKKEGMEGGGKKEEEEEEEA